MVYIMRPINIFNHIVHTDKTEQSFKEYVKTLKVNLKSLREYIAEKENMTDRIKEKIDNILKKQEL